MSLQIAFLGSSLLSSYWNGAATYYRGIIQALHRLGCRTTFYEPDAFDRQQHRDIEPPLWARVVVYPADEQSVSRVCEEASTADVIIKASGVGVLDDELLSGLLKNAPSHSLRVFWDVDAPATLNEMAHDIGHPVRAALSRLDLILTYGGGDPVVTAYGALGARRCEPIYNALDPTTHHPVPPDPRYDADLAFLGNRLPDREERVERYFFSAARRLPARQFLIGGAGWEPAQSPKNVRTIGHVPTSDHNAFNCTPLAVINIARNSMADTGFSPATRVFEAAGAGACLITDDWDGIDMFLEPGREILVARDGRDVAEYLTCLVPEQARMIGDNARKRVLRDHTYDQRAATVKMVLESELARKRERLSRPRVRA